MKKLHSFLSDLFLICLSTGIVFIATSEAYAYRYVKVCQPNSAPEVDSCTTNSNARELLTDFDQDGIYEPFIIQGVGYSPYPIGRHPSDWGWPTPRSPTDLRKNNIYDDPAILNRDFTFLNAMNANTIRIWKGNNTEKCSAGVCRFPVQLTLNTLNLAEQYNLKVIAGFWMDPMGSWTCTAEGSKFNLAIDYTNQTVRQNIKDAFGNYVNQFKDHPALLFWAIGNENNLFFGDDPIQIQAFFSLVNEMAELAHTIEDPTYPLGKNYHPVSLINGDLSYIGEEAFGSSDLQMNHLDLWGSNVYRGQSFGDFFSKYELRSDKPLWISEYGVDAWSSGKTLSNENAVTDPTGFEDQASQALWVGNLWDEIVANKNVAIGGSVMEYSDEWWKPNEWTCLEPDPKNPTQCLKFNYEGHNYFGFAPRDLDCPQDGYIDWTPPAPDQYSNEEWWGLMAIAPNSVNPVGPDELTPRQAYFTLQKKFTPENKTAQMISPTVETTLESAEITFTWDQGIGASQYWLAIGSIQGTGDIYDSNQTTHLTQTISNLPLNGLPLYVRLYSRFSTGWIYEDYVYQRINAAPAPVEISAEMQTPTLGTTLTTEEVTFTWNKGTGALQYWLTVGSGQGAGNIYDANQSTRLSQTISGLSLDGSPLYARLYSRFPSGWIYEDYVYQRADNITPPAETPATMQIPAMGAPLTTEEVTFTWDKGTGVRQYWLTIGTTRGSGNIYDANQWSGLSKTISGIQLNGDPVYVRLYSNFPTGWIYEEYIYQRLDTIPAPLQVPAQIQNPVPNTTLSTENVTFTWNAGTGVRQYWLTLGSTPWSGNIYDANQGRSLSHTINEIVLNGSPLYGHLYSKFPNGWIRKDFMYFRSKK